MTIEDRIRSSMAGQVARPPELSGLSDRVADRARVLRLRRRVVASVSTCVAVVAVAVPLVFKVSGAPEPQHPQTTTAVLPSTAVPASDFGLLPTPAAFQPDLPAGVGPTLPLLLQGDGNQLVLQDSQGSSSLGTVPAAITEPAVQTPYGTVFRSGDALELVTSRRRLVLLTEQSGLRGWAVSDDGRSVAWGRAVPGATTGEYGIYDLATSSVVDRVTAPRPGAPTGFLADGRVSVDTDDGSTLGALVWTPATGGLVTQAAAVSGAAAVDGHLIVLESGLDRCATSIEDVATLQRVALTGCLEVRGASGDGRRLLAMRNSSPVLVAAGTGKTDDRLARLLTRTRLKTDQAAWVDDAHLVLVTESLTAAASRYFFVLACSVPESGQVTCSVTQRVGPYVLVPAGPTARQGQLPFLVRLPGS